MQSEMSRRAILAGTAALVPAASLGAVPALAEPDPALAVAARALAAHDALTAAIRAGAENLDIPEADADDDAYDDMLGVVPTTLEGLAAMIAAIAHEQRVPEEGDYPRVPYFRSDEDTCQFIENMDETLRRLTAPAA